MVQPRECLGLIKSAAYSGHKATRKCICDVSGGDANGSCDWSKKKLCLAYGAPVRTEEGTRQQAG